MKFWKEQQQTLQRIFRTAYHTREAVQVDERWEQNVMRQIRKRGPLQPQPPVLLLWNQCVWRFAIVVCLVALLLWTYSWQTDFTSEYTLASLWIEDPIEMMLDQSFGR